MTTAELIGVLVGVVGGGAGILRAFYQRNQEQFTEWSTSKLELQNYQHAVEKAAKDAAPPNVKP